MNTVRIVRELNVCHPHAVENHRDVDGSLWSIDPLFTNVPVQIVKVMNRLARNSIPTL